MKLSTQKFSAVSKVLCKLFGHKLQVSKNVTNHIHEYTCAKCGVEMTDTANGLLERLTPQFKETNEYIAQVYQRRRQRQFVNAS